MTRRKKISFLAKKRTDRKITFEAHGKKVSFIAKTPSKRREKISFYIRQKGKKR